MPGRPMTRQSHVILADLNQTPEWWEGSLDRIACGDSPQDVAAEHCILFGVFMRWVYDEDHPERRKDYEDALRIAAEARAHECIPIADNANAEADVARDRLRIDTRMKLAGKWHRERYGDKDAGMGGGATIKVELITYTAPTDRVERVVIEGQAQPERPAIEITPAIPAEFPL